MPYGLKHEVFDRIISVFREHPGIEKVTLYGSRAKGTYRNGSDIDLTITGESLALTDLYKIRDELDNLMLPYSIDLSLYRQITNKDLLDHIDRGGLEFYTREY